MGNDLEQTTIGLGTTVYTDDGDEIGTIRGFDESGCYVTVRDGLEGMSVEHVRSGKNFGEAHLMWRCQECGEMGELNGEIPTECPSCQGPGEGIYYWTED